LSSEGKRFAALPPRSEPEEKGSVHVTFVLNILDELRRRMPTADK
jgi:hypothetical protein